MTARPNPSKQRSQTTELRQNGKISRSCSERSAQAADGRNETAVLYRYTRQQKHFKATGISQCQWKPIQAERHIEYADQRLWRVLCIRTINKKPQTQEQKRPPSHPVQRSGSDLGMATGALSAAAPSRQGFPDMMEYMAQAWAGAVVEYPYISETANTHKLRSPTTHRSPAPVDELKCLKQPEEEAKHGQQEKEAVRRTAAAAKGQGTLKGKDRCATTAGTQPGSAQKMGEETAEAVVRANSHRPTLGQTAGTSDKGRRKRRAQNQTTQISNCCANRTSGCCCCCWLLNLPALSTTATKWQQKQWVAALTCNKVQTHSLRSVTVTCHMLQKR
eukprot:3996571-Amphidinium_carterae.4